jgi:hypothetical protein
MVAGHRFAERCGMTKLLLGLLASVVPFCAGRAQALDPGKLVGRWTGRGVFFSAELRKKVDSLPFVLEIERDRTGTGRVGDVSLQDVRVMRTRRYIEVRARLARPVSADPSLAKDRLVLVFTALDDNTASGEFHLKTNFVYDIRMREGRVLLARGP